MIAQIDNNSGLEFINSFVKRLKSLHKHCTKLGKFVVLPFFVLSLLYVVFIGLMISILNITTNIIFMGRFVKVRATLRRFFNELLFQ